MKNTIFYAICAKGLGNEDGFYKVEAENFGEHIFYHGKNNKDTQDIKGSLIRNEAQKLIKDLSADESEPIILHQEFKDIQNAENNAKIQNVALRDRLITKAKDDCKRLRAIFAKTKVDTAIYFENECGEIKYLWFEIDNVEQYGAIKMLMMIGKAFVVVDFVATKDPLIRVCKGYETEFIDEYEPKDE